MNSPVAPPSPLRIPVTVLVTVLIPPLGLAAWVLLSGGHRAKYLRSRWVRAGGIVFAVGSLPLLLVGLADLIGLLHDPNPIGLGLLFLAAAIVGTLLALIGVLRYALGNAGAQ